MTTYWIVTLGKAEVADGTVTYIPALITEGPNVGQNALTILRSNMELESGEVTYEAHLNEPTSKCQVGLRSEEDGTLFAGLNVGTAGGQTLFAFRRVRTPLVSSPEPVARPWCDRGVNS